MNKGGMTKHKFLGRNCDGMESSTMLIIKYSDTICAHRIRIYMPRLAEKLV